MSLNGMLEIISCTYPSEAEVIANNIRGLQQLLYETQDRLMAIEEITPASLDELLNEIPDDRETH